MVAGRTDDAIAQLKQTLELDPHMGWAHGWMALAYARKGLRSRALDECRDAIKAMPDDPNVLASCGMAYGWVGERDLALGVLEKLKRMGEKTYVEPEFMATTYDVLGDTDQAFVWLERGLRDRSFGMFLVGVEMWSDRLRADPRFKDIVRDIGLADHWRKSGKWGDFARPLGNDDFEIIR